MARQRKESQHQTFGVALEELALIEGQKIPPIIHSCFREIEERGVTEEGIYRISGILGEIRQLKSAFDECARNGEILASEAEVNVVAGVVKQFFRELPKPLFPVEMFNDFVELLDSKDEADKEKMMNAFGDIPEPNISVIVRLIQHIKYIAEYQPKNKMDLNNLCLLFGPNVVKPPNSSGQPTCEMLTNTTRQQVSILKFFCEKQLCELQELHGDEESLRPIIAPPLATPNNRNTGVPLLRHASVPSHGPASTESTDDAIVEEEDPFSPARSERSTPDPFSDSFHALPPHSLPQDSSHSLPTHSLPSQSPLDLPSLSIELSNGLILSPVDEGASNTPQLTPSITSPHTMSFSPEEIISTTQAGKILNEGSASMTMRRNETAIRTPNFGMSSTTPSEVSVTEHRPQSCVVDEVASSEFNREEITFHAEVKTQGYSSDATRPVSRTRSVEHSVVTLQEPDPSPCECVVELEGRKECSGTHDSSSLNEMRVIESHSQDSITTNKIQEGTVQDSDSEKILSQNTSVATSHAGSEGGGFDIFLEPVSKDNENNCERNVDTVTKSDCLQVATKMDDIPVDASSSLTIEGSTCLLQNVENHESYAFMQNQYDSTLTTASFVSQSNETDLL